MSADSHHNEAIEVQQTSEKNSSFDAFLRDYPRDNLSLTRVDSKLEPQDEKTPESNVVPKIMLDERNEDAKGSKSIVEAPSGVATDSESAYDYCRLYVLSLISSFTDKRVGEDNIRKAKDREISELRHRSTLLQSSIAAARDEEVLLRKKISDLESFVLSADSSAFIASQLHEERTKIVEEVLRKRERILSTGGTVSRGRRGRRSSVFRDAEVLAARAQKRHREGSEGSSARPSIRMMTTGGQLVGDFREKAVAPTDEERPDGVGSRTHRYSNASILLRDVRLRQKTMSDLDDIHESIWKERPPHTLDYGLKKAPLLSFKPVFFFVGDGSSQFRNYLLHNLNRTLTGRDDADPTHFFAGVPFDPIFIAFGRDSQTSVPWLYLLRLCALSAPFCYLIVNDGVRSKLSREELAEARAVAERASVELTAGDDTLPRILQKWINHFWLKETTVHQSEGNGSLGNLRRGSVAVSSLTEKRQHFDVDDKRLRPLSMPSNDRSIAAAAVAAEKEWKWKQPSDKISVEKDEEGGIEDGDEDCNSDGKEDLTAKGEKESDEKSADETKMKRTSLRFGNLDKELPNQNTSFSSGGRTTRSAGVPKANAPREFTSGEKWGRIFVRRRLWMYQTSSIEETVQDQLQKIGGDDTTRSIVGQIILDKELIEACPREHLFFYHGMDDAVEELGARVVGDFLILVANYQIFFPKSLPCPVTLLTRPYGSTSLGRRKAVSQSLVMPADRKIDAASVKQKSEHCLEGLYFGNSELLELCTDFLLDGQGPAARLQEENERVSRVGLSGRTAMRRPSISRLQEDGRQTAMIAPVTSSSLKGPIVAGSSAVKPTIGQHISKERARAADVKQPDSLSSAAVDSAEETQVLSSELESAFKDSLGFSEGLSDNNPSLWNGKIDRTRAVERPNFTDGSREGGKNRLRELLSQHRNELVGDKLSQNSATLLSFQHMSQIDTSQAGIILDLSLLDVKPPMNNAPLFICGEKATGKTALLEALHEKALQHRFIVISENIGCSPVLKAHRTLLRLAKQQTEAVGRRSKAPKALKSRIGELLSAVVPEEYGNDAIHTKSSGMPSLYTYQSEGLVEAHTAALLQLLLCEFIMRFDLPRKAFAEQMSSGEGRDSRRSSGELSSSHKEKERMGASRPLRPLGAGARGFSAPLPVANPHRGPLHSVRPMSGDPKEAAYSKILRTQSSSALLQLLYNACHYLDKFYSLRRVVVILDGFQNDTAFRALTDEDEMEYNVNDKSRDENVAQKKREYVDDEVSVAHEPSAKQRNEPSTTPPIQDSGSSAGQRSSLENEGAVGALDVEGKKAKSSLSAFVEKEAESFEERTEKRWQEIGEQWKRDRSDPYAVRDHIEWLKHTAGAADSAGEVLQVGEDERTIGIEGNGNSAPANAAQYSVSDDKGIFQSTPTIKIGITEPEGAPLRFSDRDNTKQVKDGCDSLRQKNSSVDTATTNSDSQIWQGLLKIILSRRPPDNLRFVIALPESSNGLRAAVKQLLGDTAAGTLNVVDVPRPKVDEMRRYVGQYLRSRNPRRRLYRGIAVFSRQEDSSLNDDILREEEKEEVEVRRTLSKLKGFRNFGLLQAYVELGIQNFPFGSFLEDAEGTTAEDVARIAKAIHLWERPNHRGTHPNLTSSSRLPSRLAVIHNAIQRKVSPSIESIAFTAVQRCFEVYNVPSSLQGLSLFSLTHMRRNDDDVLLERQEREVENKRKDVDLLAFLSLVCLSRLGLWERDILEMIGGSSAAAQEIVREGLHSSGVLAMLQSFCPLVLPFGEGLGEFWGGFEDGVFFINAKSLWGKAIWTALLSAGVRDATVHHRLYQYHAGKSLNLDLSFIEALSPMVESVFYPLTPKGTKQDLLTAFEVAYHTRNALYHAAELRNQGAFEELMLSPRLLAVLLSLPETVTIEKLIQSDEGLENDGDSENKAVFLQRRAKIQSQGWLPEWLLSSAEAELLGFLQAAVVGIGGQEETRDRTIGLFELLWQRMRDDVGILVNGGLRITWFCARTARALGRLPASLTWLSRHSEVISTLNAVAGELLNEEEERANELQRELNDRRETEVEGSAKSDAEKGRGSKGEQHSKEDDQVDGRDGIFASRCGAAEMMRESLALPQKERPAAKASAQQKKGKEPRAAFEETEARVRRKVKEEEVTAGRAASEVLRELGLCSRALALSSEALKLSKEWIGDMTEQTALCMEQLGKVFRDLGAHEEGASWLKQSLATREFLVYQSLLSSERKQSFEVVKKLKESTTIHSHVLWSVKEERSGDLLSVREKRDVERYLLSLQNMARVATELSKYDTAEEALAEALQISSLFHGRDAIATAKVEEELGLLLGVHMGQREVSIPHLLHAITVYQNEFGAESEEVKRAKKIVEKARRRGVGEGYADTTASTSLTALMREDALKKDGSFRSENSR